MGSQEEVSIPPRAPGCGSGSADGDPVLCGACGPRPQLERKVAEAHLEKLPTKLFLGHCSLLTCPLTPQGNCVQSGSFQHFKIIDLEVSGSVRQVVGDVEAVRCEVVSD